MSATLPVPEDPQGFLVHTETRQAATNNGYRIEGPVKGGWAEWSPTIGHGAIHLAAADKSGPWFLAIEHPGVVRELGIEPAEMPGPGIARYSFATTTELHQAVAWVYRLATSLPDAPLDLFRARTAPMPRKTEVERLAVQRIGQEIFRGALMDYWGSRCPLTGITEPELLRASHIRPWAACESDEERLDVHNGLLLSALWDAAFDRHLVSFTDDGTPIFSPRLGLAAQLALLPKPARITRLSADHLPYLAEHRELVVEAGHSRKDLAPSGSA